MISLPQSFQPVLSRINEALCENQRSHIFLPLKGIKRKLLKPKVFSECLQRGSWMQPDRVEEMIGNSQAIFPLVGKHVRLGTAELSITLCSNLTRCLLTYAILPLGQSVTHQQVRESRLSKFSSILIGNSMSILITESLPLRYVYVFKVRSCT